MRTLIATLLGSSSRNPRLAMLIATVVAVGSATLAPLSGQTEPAAEAADDPILAPFVPPEFEFRSAGADRWSAPNRDQGIRAAVTAATIEVSPRAHADEWQWILVSERFGRGENLFPWPEAFGSIGDRDEVRFPTATLESWVRNEPCGIEQGWTVLTPPSAPLSGGAVVIELRSVGLTPALSTGGEEIHLRSASGDEKLVYSSLLVWDADGTILPSHFEVTGDVIRIVVDDRAATYPIEIDPLVTAPAFWTLSGDQSGSEYGISIAGGHDLDGDGLDDLIVGASVYDAGAVDEGMVFLYSGGAPGTPSATPIWTGEGDDGSAQYGRSVSIVGDVNGDGFADLLVGAPGARTGGQPVGGAYLYYGPLGGPTTNHGDPTNADWDAFGPNLGSGFGTAVAGAGDLNGDGFSDLIVGAPQALVGGQARGRAYVYLGSATGPVSPPLVVDGIGSGDQFGASVSSAGNFDGDAFEHDEVIVGAPNHASGAMVAVGAAYAYRLDATGTALEMIWQLQGTEPSASVGSAVAGGFDVDGLGVDDVVVGAYLRNSPGPVSDAGAIHLFRGETVASLPGAALPQIVVPGDAPWTVFGDQTGETLGGAVALIGDLDEDLLADIVAGARLYDLGTASGSNAGRVAVFLGKGIVADLESGLVPGTFRTVNTTSDRTYNGTNGGFGVEVADAGDLDGDGYGDLAVGAHGYDGALINEGRISVHLGFADCNGNLVPDDQEPLFMDCDQDGTPDSCEADCDGNGLPDDCEGILATHTWVGSFAATPGAESLVFCTGPEVVPPQATCGFQTSGSLLDLDVTVSATFSTSSFQLRLTHPDGFPSIILYNGLGGVSSGVPMHFDDDGAVGSLLPVEPLGIFDIGDFAGEWLLSVQIPVGETLTVTEFTLAANHLDATFGDCDGNGLRDRCEISEGTALDCNADLVLDSCQDSDGDGIADDCDNCPNAFNPTQVDLDGDGVGNTCDICLNFDNSIDADGDSIPDACDNCPLTPNTDQADCDGDGIGDACEIDCDLNGVPDDCDLIAGTALDCDANGQLDICDIAAGAPDCNLDGQIDTCQGLPDCDANGIFDPCDLLAGTHADCDLNGVPDQCDPDCDGDGIPDACELDCDGDGLPDDCELLAGSLDCNLDGIPDECQADCDGDGVPDDCETDCDANGTPDDCDLIAGTATDCDANGTLDSCDLAAGAPDCDGNGTLDSCELASGAHLDCNANSIPDACDIASGASLDCDLNGVPDECQPDCDGNGLPDACEPDCDSDGIADPCALLAGSLDCNLDGIPDECQSDCDGDGIPDDCETDCDGNGTPDDCDLIAGTATDCDANGTLDSCDLAAGAPDCDGNEILDSCELASGAHLDCNANGVPDACDLAAATSADCNSDGIPDECQPDCDGNGIPDDCEPDCDGDGLADPCALLAGSLDCDADGIPDECEADCDADGTPDDCETDCDGNGVPDDCDLAAGTHTDCNLNLIPDACDVLNGIQPDPTPPAIQGMPQNATLVADPGGCTAVATWTVPTVLEDCGLASFSSTAQSGEAFPVGTTIVTYSATDIFGNVATSSFSVTVTDLEMPSIVGMPAPITVDNDAGLCSAVVTWVDPIALDNCPDATIATSHPSGSIFPVGTTIVTITATDASGSAVSDTFSVTVLDAQSPLLSDAPLSFSLTTDPGTCATTATWTEPTMTDNCPGASVVSTHLPGDAFLLGDTTVTYTATDAAGHVTTVSFTVTVEDLEAPMIAGVPADMTLDQIPGTCAALATWIEPTASDNCSVASLTADFASGASFPVGTTTVTYTALDGSGNPATASFTVTVNDTEAPTIAGLPADMTLSNDPGLCSALATWPIPTIEDNCPGVLFQTTHPIGSSFSLGTTTVTYSAEDASGNTMTASFDVTVIDDEAPTIGVGAAIVVPADLVGCNAAVVVPAPTLADNCPGVTVANSFTATADASGTYPAGTTTVTFTATDAAGNSATATLDITVDVPMDDCNGNGIPDACDIAQGTSTDCAPAGGLPDGIPDECQADCDLDGIPDRCEPDCDGDGIPDDCETVGDCNGNGIPDDCDITAGASVDCDLDGVPDECELASGSGLDCNANGTLDNCDIAAGTSADCNASGIPDECEQLPDCDGDGLFDVCEPDCDGDGIPDDCENEPDCNGNGIPDDCDVAPGGASDDCNANGIPDECEPDCNGNGIPDACDLGGVFPDCNTNGIPDACEIQLGMVADCQPDGVPDLCQPDCNSDGIPDSCEPDCDGDGLPDDCEPDKDIDCDQNGIPDMCESDCDGNGVNDVCDIANGTYLDQDGNGIPDVCECPDLQLLDCSINAGVVTLNWSMFNTYQSIEVRRDGQLVSMLGGGETSFTSNLNLVPECIGSFTYAVRGVCSNLAATPELSCTVDMVPAMDFTFALEDQVVEYPVNWSETQFSVRPTIVESSGNPCFPNPTLGFSMGVRHDANVLEALAVAPTLELVQAVGGAGPAFFSSDIFVDGWTLGVAYSVGGTPTTVPISVELPVAAITYRTTCALSGLPASTTSLTFTSGPDDLGTPPVQNVIVVEGMEFDPTRIDATISLSPVGEVAFLRGDCNGNGSVAISDAITMLNLVFGNGGATTCLDACDPNDSGSLTIGDPIYVLNFLFASGPAPIAPNPFCGLDGTADTLDCQAFGACPACTD